MNFKNFCFLTLLFSFILFKKVNAQTYFPILNNYSEWHVTNCYFGCLTDKYYNIGDTIINGLHYSFLDKYHYNKNFVIREDTTTRKVYMRLLAEPSTTKEYLLYDFSLQVNDTMFVSNPGSPFPKYAGNFIVDSIKVRPLVNGNRKFFYLHSLDTTISVTKNTVWVEGIGSLCLINTPGAPPQINGAGQLSCYFHNGVNEYQNLDSISNCIAIYPLGLNEYSLAEKIHIYQNFESQTVFISLPQKGNPYLISIYTIEGKLVLTTHVINETVQLNLSDVCKGVLLLKIVNGQTINHWSKLINP